MKSKSIDKIFFGLIVTLVIFGIVMFTSASMGILAKNPAKFYDVIFNQFLFGLLGGGIAMYCAYRIPYKFWRTYSLTIFIVSILITASVFIPGIGFAHGGARRWINIFGISFQPVEFLKIAFVIYFAAWLSWIKIKVRDLKFSVIPLIVLLAIIAGVLLKQPDTKSVILIAVTAMIMLFISGMPWKYIFGIFIVCILGFGLLVSFTPYLRNRVDTFLHPSRNQSTSSYQLQQSLIAIGSGGIFGRGLGQSIQKYSYLPEPQGDSIFAVIGEETGFIGAVAIIILFIIFAFRGFKISYYAPDSFSKLLIIGFITITLAQAFMNIASIIGVFPLTGVPLPFISHGGTSLLITLGAMG
ncbi:putative lipid II flippase FtsW, partial [Candidatus Nomurabacteria bacterium]|nr:putative lipid II flippase FtsW [Candidatus Nomurabacteria bacterium]